jgi:hypothetical protein
MNIIFIDDSKGYMEQLFSKPQSNSGRPLFMELLEKEMMPITIFFGNFENEYNIFKPIGVQELNQFLDNYAKRLFRDGYNYDKDHPLKCIYKKEINNKYISVDVNESAFLLYKDYSSAYQEILQVWDGENKDKIKYNAEDYGLDVINNFLKKLYEEISNKKGDVVLLDMLLIINDQERLVNEQKNHKPILSMIIYHYLRSKSIRCGIYSTYAKRKIYQEKWIEKYNEYFKDQKIEREDFIIDRQQLNTSTIEKIYGNN